MFGGFSAWAVNRHLNEKTLEIETRTRLPSVSRIVAAHGLKMGHHIEINDLAVREFNDPLHGLLSVDPADVDLLVGKVLIQDIGEGQLIPASFVTARVQSHLVSKLEAGMRAVTIPVDQINSMSGLLKPGDRIDLLVSFEYLGQRVTSPLLSGIEVIATGRETNSHSSSIQEHQVNFETVTLATNSAEAVKLVAARQSGTITAVLSQGNRKGSTADSVSQMSGHLAKLLGLEMPHPENIPVIYGDRSDVVSIDEVDRDALFVNTNTSSEAHR